MKIWTNLVTVITLFSLQGCGSGSPDNEKQEQPPNIIYILADDLGYGDLGCYGQDLFTTPHIDSMARSGIRFTRHYAGSTVCAPSRSVLLTGLHTGHTPVRGNKEVQPEGQFPLPEEAYTLAEMLKQQGYVTGAFGKWGLGYPGSEGDPLQQGFDRFFGYNCQRYAHRYYPKYLWDNEQKYDLKGNDWSHAVTYAPDVIQQKAIEFIKEHRDTTFFAYVPVVIPHAELIIPEDSVFYHYLGRFPEKPYAGRPGADYGPDMVIGMYCSQEYPHATFASMVTRLDNYVGEIMQTLNDLGISERTLVLFSSDNGPHMEGGADPSFFNSSGGLRGIKRDLYEGGIRVPFIACWPGTIEPGRVSSHISAFWDVFPTLANLTGLSPHHTDGISFLPELFGETQPPHQHLYWEFHEQGGKQALLMEGWKAIRMGVGNNPSAPLELYNLSEDPQENNNVASKHPDLVNKFSKIMTEERIPSETFDFGRTAQPKRGIVPEK